jgi:gluconolactonase
MANYRAMGLWAGAAGFALAIWSVAMSDSETFDIRSAQEFGRVVAPEAKLEKLAGDLRFTEGPVWLGGDDGYLVFSDIPAQRLYRWSPKDGLSVFRENSNGANGNTLDRAGHLVTCEHSSRQVTRTDSDGAVDVIAADYQGKKFNSPNDVVVKSDGCVYFTDPDYGLRDKSKREVPKNYVFRLDPARGEVRAIADDFDMPNGLCFSPDEKLLYIADSGKPRHIRVFEVQADGSIANGRVFCAIDKGVPDGIRTDAEGRVYSSAGDGVQVFTPAGGLIGKILVPESPANLCLGGPGKKTLFITARTSLYAIRLK